jgi:multidrug resistance protein MdtO
VKDLLDCYVAEQRPDDKMRHRLSQYTTIGTGHLRELLVRSSYQPEYRGQLGAVLSLSGRLVDLSANMAELPLHPSEHDRSRIANISQEISSLRLHLMKEEVPELLMLEDESAASVTMPSLVELERNVRLISQVFVGHPLEEHLPAPGEGRTPGILVPDALSNPDHLRFALRGSFSAMLCYVCYMGLGWPGLNTALATCVLTALSNVGTSRQKQVLRVVGALIGGCIFGFGSQAFLLPHMDSIAEFAVLFAAVTAVAAWVTTSSPRLAYSGLQIALAYDLINLNGFAINTSLEVARDRVMGSLLGLFAMWLIYDRLWTIPAAVEMKTLFLANMRHIARFATRPPSERQKREPGRLWAERDAINSNFSNVRSQTDAVLLEFRPQREQDLAMRDRIRAWQPELRTLFMVKLGLLQYRLRAPNGELHPVAERVQAHTGEMLDDIAGIIDGLPDTQGDRWEQNTTKLLAQIEREERESNRETPAQLATVLTLSHSLLTLTASLYRNVRERLAE